MSAKYIEAPRFAVLKASGINRDFATCAAIQAAGGRAEIVPVNTFLNSPRNLFDYRALIIPGGFSYGDDIQSGVILALDLLKLKVELEEFAFHHKRPIIGVCNGFQALVQSGLLPFGIMNTRDQLSATLTTNASGKFESRWVWAKPQESVSVFVREGAPVTAPVDKGEGKFFATAEAMGQINSGSQIVYQYSDTAGTATMEYPANPNGSMESIAGLTDPSGTVLGTFLHFEDFVRREHHPNWRRGEVEGEPHGLQFYKQVVVYAAQI